MNEWPTNERGIRNRRLPVARAAGALAILLGGCLTASLHAADWLSGVALQKRLAAPVGIAWAGTPLREAIENLSRTQDVAVLIDRRVDPGQELRLSLDPQPLEATLRAIARGRQLGVSLLGPVAYFGPPRATSRLRTIAALRTEEVRQRPLDAQRTWLVPKPMAWDDLATPRELLASLAEQNAVAIEGADAVPHDLWAAADLPSLSLVDRLTLILIQFDLTFQVDADGVTIRLVALPEEVAIPRDYPGGPDPRATAERLARLAPGARVEVAGDKVRVAGLLEDHERIDGGGQATGGVAPGPPDRGLADKRFTLRVEEEPVGAVLRSLARQLQLDVRIDEQSLAEVGISLESRISLNVKDVDVDGLLRAVLSPAGLGCRRRGSVVEVVPAP